MRWINGMATDTIFEVEEIIGKRWRNGTKEYLIHWKGYSEQEDSWEPEKNLIGCQELVREFQKNNKTPSPARKPNRQSKSIGGTPKTPQTFTKIKTKRAEDKEHQELKVLRLKTPEIMSGLHKVKKEEALQEQEEKAIEKRQFWTVLMSWVLAVALFLTIMMYLLPVVQ